MYFCSPLLGNNWLSHCYPAEYIWNWRIELGANPHVVPQALLDWSGQSHKACLTHQYHKACRKSILWLILLPTGQYKSAGFLNLLWGSVTFYTKSWLCYTYFKKQCCFSNCMPPKGPKNWIYNNLKYPFPPSDTILDWRMGHFGWFFCPIP